MKTILFYVLIIGLLFSQNLFADSPLTSTDISKAYTDPKVVQLASQTEGELTIELMDYLNAVMYPLELKIALINELGWDFNGKDKATIFYEYLKKRTTIKKKMNF